jgi:hypothetical protein
MEKIILSNSSDCALIFKKLRSVMGEQASCNKQIITNV